MASIYSGRGSVIGLATEDDYGTAKARSNWRPVISSSLTRTIEKVPRPSLRVGTLGAMRRSNYVSVDSAGGSFSVECTYENVGLLLHHWLGSSSTYTATGSAPFTHTYKIAEDVPLGLTIENVRGTGTSEVFEGARISSGTLSVASAGMMSFEAEVIAETSAARGSAGTPSFGSGDTPVLHSHAGVMAWGGSSYDLIDFSVTVNNALSTRQHLGSAATKKPLRSDFQTVEVSCTVECDDALMAAYLANTESDGTITFTSGSQSFKVEFQNAYLSACSDPISDASIVQQSLTFTCQSDGTNEGIEITVINANATATAN